MPLAKFTGNMLTLFCSSSFSGRVFDNNSSNLSNKIELTSKPVISNTNFWAGISSSKEQLKWSPKTSIVEGIRRSWSQLK